MDEKTLWEFCDDAIDYEEEIILLADQKIKIQSLPEQLPVEVLSMLADANVEISGRCPWPGSLILATYLLHAQNRKICEGKKCIELGAGSGILGLALNKLADDVVLTDADPFALNLIRSNLDCNTISGVLVKQLRWGSPVDIREVKLALGERYLNECLDVVLAADVCYKEEIVLPLMTTSLMMAPNLILCHIPRHGVTHDFVIKCAKDVGFKLMEDIMVDEAMLNRCPENVRHGVGCTDAQIFVFRLNLTDDTVIIENRGVEKVARQFSEVTSCTDDDDSKLSSRKNTRLEESKKYVYKAYDSM